MIVYIPARNVSQIEVKQIEIAYMCTSATDVPGPAGLMRPKALFVATFQREIQESAVSWWALEAPLRSQT